MRGSKNKIWCASSSIYPTSCKIIPIKEGQPKLKPGQITFVVLAEAATDEPNRLICAGIGLAIPRNHAHGYIAEHHGYGMTEKKTEDLCEDLAATMLATTLGIPFDADKNWDEREQQYKMSGEIFKTRAVVQTAEGDKSGLWTSVISAVVFILDKNGNGEKPAGEAAVAEKAIRRRPFPIAWAGLKAILNFKFELLLSAAAGSGSESRPVPRSIRRNRCR